MTEMRVRLGISDARLKFLEERMTDMLRKSKTANDAMEKIARASELEPNERLFAAFIIGVTIGQNDTPEIVIFQNMGAPRGAM